jgi:hypothetical protein
MLRLAQEVMDRGGFLPTCLIDSSCFLCQSSENGVGRGAATDARSASARALTCKLPSKTIGDLPLVFGVASLDRVDSPVALGVDRFGLPPLRLIGERKVETN